MNCDNTTYTTNLWSAQSIKYLFCNLYEAILPTGDQNAPEEAHFAHEIK